jgi:hypothetical protein
MEVLMNLPAKSREPFTQTRHLYFGYMVFPGIMSMSFGGFIFHVFYSVPLSDIRNGCYKNAGMVN